MSPGSIASRGNRSRVDLSSGPIELRWIGMRAAWATILPSASHTQEEKSARSRTLSE